MKCAKRATNATWTWHRTGREPLPARTKSGSIPRRIQSLCATLRAAGKASRWERSKPPNGLQGKKVFTNSAISFLRNWYMRLPAAFLLVQEALNVYGMRNSHGYPVSGGRFFGRSHSAQAGPASDRAGHRLPRPLWHDGREPDP